MILFYLYFIFVWTILFSTNLIFTFLYFFHNLSWMISLLRVLSLKSRMGFLSSAILIDFSETRVIIKQSWNIQNQTSNIEMWKERRNRHEKNACSFACRSYDQWLWFLTYFARRKNRPIVFCISSRRVPMSTEHAPITLRTFIIVSKRLAPAVSLFQCCALDLMEHKT